MWPQPQDALASILEASLWNNAREGITGALGFSGGHYVQLLEGTTAALDGLLTKLAADPRHQSLAILVREPVERRMLPGWSMARVDLIEHAPKVTRLLESGDGLALINLLGNLARAGVTTVV